MSGAGIRLPALPFAALALQYAAGFEPLDGGRLEQPVVLVSHAVVAVWLIVNLVNQAGWRRVGIGLALAGWLLNLAVMLPNGGMPVSRTAMADAGRVVTDVTDGHLSKHVPLDGDTVLPQLGDIHPLPALRLVYSAGDVLLLAGLLVILAAAWTPASLTNQRSSPEAERTRATDAPGSMGVRYSSTSRPRSTGSSSTVAQ